MSASRDEDQRDWIEEAFRFEQKRAKFQMFLAQLEYDELNIIAEDVKKMLDYRAGEIEVLQLNRAWMAGNNMTVLPSPAAYSPHKPKGDAA